MFNKEILKAHRNQRAFIVPIGSKVPLDYQMCFMYCNWLPENVVSGEFDSTLIFVSDETWFHLSGYINRIWITAEENHIWIDKPKRVYKRFFKRRKSWSLVRYLREINHLPIIFYGIINFPTTS